MQLTWNLWFAIKYAFHIFIFKTRAIHQYIIWIFRSVATLWLGLWRVLQLVFIYHFAIFYQWKLGLGRISSRDGYPAIFNIRTDIGYWNFSSCARRELIEWFGYLIDTHMFLSVQPLSKFLSGEIWRAGSLNDCCHCRCRCQCCHFRCHCQCCQ